MVGRVRSWWMCVEFALAVAGEAGDPQACDASKAAFVIVGHPSIFLQF